MKIFISYSWGNKEVAEKVDSFFRQKGIVPSIDVRDAPFNRSIKKFMEEIRIVDFALIIVSDRYLRSENCMYEITELYKDKNAENKMLPIVVDDATIYDIKGRLDYLKYWETLYQELMSMLKEISYDKGVEIRRQLNKLNNILGHIDIFTSYIADVKHVRWNSETGTCNFDEIADFLKL